MKLPMPFFKLFQKKKLEVQHNLLFKTYSNQSLMFHCDLLVRLSQNTAPHQITTLLSPMVVFLSKFAHRRQPNFTLH